MSAGKGDSPRHVHGPTYRDNYESIFRKPTHENHHAGEVVDGMECLGEGRWHVKDHHEQGLRDDDE